MVEKSGPKKQDEAPAPEQRVNLQRIVQLTQLVAQADQILSTKSIALPYCKIELSDPQIEEVRKGRDDLKKRLAELVGGL